MPLTHTLSQLSYWSALHLGKAGLESMNERGRLQKGMVAGITIVDAENVKDNAGNKVRTNGLPSTGIPYVIVNGTIVVKDSKVLEDVFPGQPIRYPLEDKGRHEPVEAEGWIDTHAVPVIEHDEGAMADWPKSKHRCDGDLLQGAGKARLVDPLPGDSEANRRGQTTVFANI